MEANLLQNNLLQAKLIAEFRKTQQHLFKVKTHICLSTHRNYRRLKEWK